tara:strand:+ start:1620 stop:1784 length:165 start_codon:yes stop_codon:yes gene_type:complete
MIYRFKFLLLALVIAGCANNNVCEPNESLLVCTSSNLTVCNGFLDAKPLIIGEF